MHKIGGVRSLAARLSPSPAPTATFGKPDSNSIRRMQVPRGLNDPGNAAAATSPGSGPYRKSNLGGLIENRPENFRRDGKIRPSRNFHDTSMAEMVRAKAVSLAKSLNAIQAAQPLRPEKASTGRAAPRIEGRLQQPLAGPRKAFHLDFPKSRSAENNRLCVIQRYVRIETTVVEV